MAVIFNAVNHFYSITLTACITQLVEDDDDTLFQSVLHNPEHTVYRYQNGDTTLLTLCDLGDMISR